ncbi:UNVERIFIED_CONTAM: Retrovirus-related Pol polyprotein from transposon [Sesamum angustifolium]|uniref:Retrovirus-related Pol polyprotein from transposon n=1 Tax=Sesamum angustifolium TaxID=2727405 RepID=A0AAW2ITE5_9LAMI
MHHYASIGPPLIDLLKFASFTWNPQASEAFTALQSAMISLPVLGLPNFSLPFDETTDASQMEIGAVLSQLHHPIAFFSKKLCSRMQSSSSYDRRCFAITEAIYRLHSLPKTIVSDCDRHFFSQFWCDLFPLFGTILSTIGFFSASILITNLWSTAGLLKNFLATFYGPLRIVKRIGQIAYELALPIGSRVHPVFHFSLLKPFDGDTPSVVDSLPLDVYSTLPNLRPTSILGRCAGSTSSDDDDELLIHWEA